ncbi:MAG: hypothetical protein KJ597_04605 [Nanoarchaeota archaeon]|nr:hypothetical protein [Nanoarchaeota archaeon]MBU1622827.1 hypothetical protein [Nanoarchaeota archaeon]
MKQKFSLKRYKYAANKDFFKKWNSQMAYVLGFTCADGNVHGSTLAWDLSDKFYSNQKLLEKINTALNSTYPIKKRKNSYRLRISNSIILSDIQKLGIVPNKKKILAFPDVPNEYLRDFIRGFLDGDGWITIRSRKNDLKEICVGFSNGSLTFMKILVAKLNQSISLSGHNLRTRKKITPKGIKTTTYQLEYYSHNAFSLIQYLYNNLEENDLYLGRKFQKQLEARKIYFEYSLKSKSLREKEVEFGMNMKSLLQELMFQKGFDGVQIAKELNVHSSTIYRWLEKTNVRKPTIRGSEEWKRRVFRN